MPFGHLFGMLPKPGCGEWVAVWAHGVWEDAGWPGWLEHSSGLQTAPGALLSLGVVLISGRPRGSCVWGGGSVLRHSS